MTQNELAQPVAGDAPPDRAADPSGPRRPDHDWLVPLFALGIIPTALLIDTAIALARGWKLTSRLDLALVLLLGLSLALLVSVPFIPACRSALRRRRPQMVLFHLSVVTILAVVLGEIALALAAFAPRHVETYHLRRQNHQDIFRPKGGIMPGISGESRFTTNSIGVRGPEWPDRSSADRLLCIGGSTTECCYLDDEEAWPHLLMQQLNREPGRRPTWVGNIGVSGFSTVHHLRFMERSDLPSQVDSIVFLVGANDFLSFLLGGRPLHEHRYVDHSPKSSWVAPFWSSSSLMNFVRATKRAWIMERCLIIEDPEGQNYELRRRRRQAARFRDRLPDIERGLSDYRQRLRAIVELCRAKGVRPVFLTQPAIWSSHLTEQGRSLLWLGQIQMRDTTYLSPEALLDGIHIYNKTLIKLCDQLDVQCIDLATSMDGQEDLYYDDFHFTEAGSREVARLVAEGLMSRPPDRTAALSGAR